MIMIEFLKISTGILFWLAAFAVMRIIDVVGLVVLITYRSKAYQKYDAYVQNHERKGRRADRKA